MTDTTTTAAAREEVMKCEQEIQSIKAALRRIGNAALSSTPDSEQNSMEIVLLKVEGLPEEAKPTLTLQMSSPIEEGILNTIYDPLNDTPSEGSMVVFRGVEPSVATLSVSAKDVDIPLGSSAPHEVAPLCALDPMDIKDKYVTELPVAIVADGTVGTAAETVVKAAAVAEVDTDATSGKDGSVVEGESKVVEEDEVVTVQPICTVTLRITYKPSLKDQREELYELLNMTSQRKATALDNLRKISMQTATANRSSAAADSPSAPSSTMTVAKPSVKPGFLNKQKDQDNKESKWTTWYNRTLGPNSMIRNGAMLAFAAKDFFIFFGAVAFFHMKGQLLAIPPPV